MKALLLALLISTPLHAGGFLHIGADYMESSSVRYERTITNCQCRVIEEFTINVDEWAPFVRVGYNWEELGLNAESKLVEIGRKDLVTHSIYWGLEFD